MGVRRRGATAAEIERVYRDRSRTFLFTVTALLRDGDAALDIVHDGFAHALSRRVSYRGDGTLEAWIWRIVLNLARDRLRTKARRVSTAAPVSWREPDDVADLRARLLELPERQRLAIFLRYYGDLTYDEIAAALGVRPGTVAASLHAAHSALRRQLQTEAVG